MTKFNKLVRHPMWKDVPDEKWSSWVWQQQNRIKRPEQLLDFGYTKKEVEELKEVFKLFRMLVTPYYASLVKDKKGPIGLQAFPQVEELTRTPDQYEDPLSEDMFTPFKVNGQFVRPKTLSERIFYENLAKSNPTDVKEVKNIIHKYPNKVLFYTTANCAVTCRHCTRKRLVNDPSSQPLINLEGEGLLLALEYIASNSDVNDVIISGGDPLSFSNKNIDSLLGKLDDVDHVLIKRIGTRNLVTLPYRVDDELVGILSKYVGLTKDGKAKNIRVNTHFNHPDELTYEAAEAVMKLKSAGVTVGNQAVLLKGVNDDATTLGALYRGLASLGVDPYYLYQCDKNFGNEHFRTPLHVGLDIMDKLTTFTSGVATPHFIKDLEGGHGKVHLPGAVMGKSIGDDGVVTYKIQTTGASFGLESVVVNYRDV